jgi:transcriptional regulator with XRE-family HTH domain
MVDSAGTIGPVRRVAARIRTLRKRRPFTQAALAKDAGVTREYRSRLKGGRHDPKLSVLDGIARALKVRLAAIVK